MDLVYYNAVDGFAAVTAELIYRFGLRSLGIAYRNIVDTGNPDLECRNDITSLVQHIGIDLEHAQHLGGGDILDCDVFDETSPAMIGLDIEQAVDLV